MKLFWIGVGLVLAGIGVLVGMVMCAINDATFVAAILLMLGGVMVYGGFLTTKGAVNDLKEKLEKEKQAGEKTTKKEIGKHVAVLVTVVVVIVAGLYLFSGLRGADYLNSQAKYALQRPFSADTPEDIRELELEMRCLTPAERLFFRYEDDIREYKEAYYAHIQQRAEEVSRAIDRLTPFTDLTSDEEYRRLSAAATDLLLSSTDDYEAQIRLKVSNYDDLEAYLAQLETVRDQYKHTCEDCGGRGGFTCSVCNGSGGYSCSSCGGAGKKVVTWYSHGDWGEKSYTSYDCTKCNGRGRSDCGSCNGGSVDCACEEGYIYIYNNEQ